MHVHQDVFSNTTVGSQLSLTYSVSELVCGRGAGEQIWLQNLVENLGGAKTWITRILG
jgi:hypothetical protein